MNLKCAVPPTEEAERFVGFLFSWFGFLCYILISYLLYCRV